MPYRSGFPTVLSQEATLIFGHSAFGRALFFLAQAGAISILFTGGNTSFSGFPFLTSFVAEDSFLPRWLSKRGHRLVFSNGIIVLTVAALALLLVVGANTNNLVPFYAIGVFTGFAMAGFGMARYHLRVKERGWRRRLVINVAGGVYTALVVVIFAVVKFTEGAWLVVAVFPVLVFAFIRLNRQYRAEADAAESTGAAPTTDPPNYPRRTVLVLIDDVDLAVIASLRYARSLHPTDLRAVHFVIDQPRADHIRQLWLRSDRAIPLDFVDCPDRRIERAASSLIFKETAQPGTHVTIVLPRRSYPPLLGRLMHDRTADKIARVTSRIPRSAATIVPYDVTARVHDSGADASHQSDPPRNNPTRGGESADPSTETTDGSGTLNGRGRREVLGRVQAVRIKPVGQSSILACTITDHSGELTVLFYGRTHIPGIVPGTSLRLRGQVTVSSTGPVMINPTYELTDPAP